MLRPYASERSKRMNDKRGKRDSRSIGRSLFRAALLALVLICIGLAASMTGTSSASVPTNSAGMQELGVQVPDGAGCWSQISTQNVMTGGNYLNAMDGDPETGAILAAGHYTTDLGLRSDGGFGSQTQMVQFYTGSSFQMVPNPPGLGTGRLNGVGAIPGTNNEFWVVGNATSTSPTTTFTLNLIMRFDGTSLSIVPNPQPEGVGNWLTDVDAASSTFAIAVGRVQSFTQGLVPVIVRWNGSSWVAETAPNVGNAELMGVTTFPDGRAVAVGIDYDPDVRHVMITRDTGGVWSTVSLMLPGSGSRLTGIDATSPTYVVAVGYSFNAQANAFRPYSVFGNLDTNTWNIVDMPAPATGDTYANAVSCHSGPAESGGLDVCVAGGENDDGFTRVLVSWEEVASLWSEMESSGFRFFAAYFAATFTLRPDVDAADGGGS